MTCTLCDLPTPDPPLTDPDVDGEYCCRGCLEVARSLDEPAATDREEVDTGPDEAEGAVAYLSVDGMHCATCETFLERRATGVDGVRAAAASYSTGTLRTTYDPDALDPETVAARVSGVGYEAGVADREGEDDEQVGRLLVGGFFAMMTMLWYVLFLYPAYLGVDPGTLFLDPASDAGLYLLGNIWVMTSVVLGYTGWPLLRGAYVSLRARQPNMDLLVGLAASTAYLYSTGAVLLGHTEVYFDVTTVIVMAVTVGNYYEDRVRRAAAGRLSEFTEERADSARRRTDEGPEDVPLAELSGGDQVVVEAGERVPVDGTVREGTAAVDRSLVTGEAVPERVAPGDDVVGGALVTDGGLVVAAADGAESTLDRLVGALWAAQSEHGGVQRLVDRVASVFVPLVIALAVAALALHLALGAGPTAALLTGLAVLVVSCPCALGLATPLGVAAGIRAALDRGVVVTGGSLFERAPAADVVAFDKTGTLTTGEMRLVERPDDGALARAAALEQFAQHPVADAVTGAVDAVDATVTDVETVPGRGVRGRVDGQRVLVGSPTMFEADEWTVPERLRERVDRARERGRVPALIGWEGRARDVVVAGDEPRPEWESALSGLDGDVVVVTGDGEAAARPFREHPAVDEVFAGVPPEGKAAVVERLRERGTVAMVGDGSNDAPALAAADLGIAMAHGTELAAEAADAVVTSDDLRTVPAVFDLARSTRGRIRQNLGWAFLYNAVAVPLAVAGVLNPLFAAVAMAISSLLVVGNSARSLGGATDDAALAGGTLHEGRPSAD
ncbi:MAG: heavy metal translocating P-type ATPase [Haloarculaceae archaeon]